jgi:hypothetical protein
MPGGSGPLSHLQASPGSRLVSGASASPVSRGRGDADGEGDEFMVDDMIVGSRAGNGYEQD